MKIKSITKKLIALTALAATLLTSVPVFAAETQEIKQLGNRISEKSSNAFSVMDESDLQMSALDTADASRSISYPSIFSNEEEIYMLMATNLVRIAYGEEPLSTFSSLQNAADTRCSELMRSWTDYRPNGEDVETIFDDYNISYNTFNEFDGRVYETAVEYMDAIISDEDFLYDMLDSDFTHMGASSKVNSSYVPYYVQLFHGSCSPKSISMWNPQNLYVIPYGESMDAQCFFLQVKCNHGTSYMPLSQFICTNYNEKLINQTQNVTIQYHGLTLTIPVYIDKPVTYFQDVSTGSWYYDAGDILPPLKPNSFEVGASYSMTPMSQVSIGYPRVSRGSFSARIRAYFYLSAVMRIIFSFLLPEY